MHCASLGELEQGKPVLTQLQKALPNYLFVITFFSPSGYEIAIKEDLNAQILYLPSDTKRNSLKFVKIIKPEIAVFVKYEFWLNYLNALHQNNIPAVLISGIFRKEQIFFKWYGKIFRKALSKYKMIFLQDSISHELLKNFNLANIKLSGDTRFDRVLMLKEMKIAVPGIIEFCGQLPVLILGSSYSEDEKMLFEVLVNHPKQFQYLKMMIVPHEINAARLKELSGQLAKNKIKFSTLGGGIDPNSRVVVIDAVGLLSRLYRFAQFAYLGGGFNNGIHSILEPLAYGIPVGFGPRHNRFAEAAEAIALGFGKEINNSIDFHAFLSEFSEKGEAYQRAVGNINRYILEKSGISQTVSHEILKMLPENGEIFD